MDRRPSCERSALNAPSAGAGGQRQRQRLRLKVLEDAYGTRRGSSGAETRKALLCCPSRPVNLDGLIDFSEMAKFRHSAITLSRLLARLLAS